MHLYAREALALATEIKKVWQRRGWEGLPTVLFPPFLYLREIVALFSGDTVAVGAQDGYPGQFGAYTGEVSMAQLADSGVRWVLVGHSERRRYFGEESPILREKVQSAQAWGLSVLYCVGETLEQRQAGETFTVLRQQVREVLEGLPIKWEGFALAYEPVWAIGTGHNATPAQAQEAHAFLRELLAQMGAPADTLPILYGGSLKPENARELFAQPDVDGGLVGGASLQAPSFTAIAEALLQTP
uniref:Triosephosphate isomerase n=1 Tax=uncultured Bacteroidota bacterium TaxID=152509 RepID=H5SNW9_9BACT|nr:triosephosphate isomerase [uncultured Bacteroidetes bacterium]